MAQKKLTAAEVLALLDADEELDDPDEVRLKVVMRTSLILKNLKTYKTKMR